jgi:hypothetical protein
MRRYSLGLRAGGLIWGGANSNDKKSVLILFSSFFMGGRGNLSPILFTVDGNKFISNYTSLSFSLRL